VRTRIGQGVDVHAFCEGDFVTLGGVKIPHSHSLAAWSDGDVVLHALCDALLGAAALGDIGRHFPPKDPQWKGVDSRELLRKVDLIIKHEGWSICNADVTIICEEPKITPYAAEMAANIAADLDLNMGTRDISIKATTTETLGFCGRREGIVAMAVVLIQKS
jgi:2-C-methyl-D-erythritol 2,4-cyclodiphosphate synthase